MWTRARPRCRRRCCTLPAKYANSAASTTATPSSTRTPWNGSAASPSSPSRPSSPRPTSPSPCSILLDTSTSPPKRNVRSPCSTTPSSSSPARTASKAIPKRCGDCSIAIRCPHSSSSTKWTRPAPTKRNCSPNSRNASRTAASTSPSRLTANAWRRSPCKTKRPWTRISTPKPCRTKPFAP